MKEYKRFKIIGLLVAILMVAGGMYIVFTSNNSWGPALSLAGSIIALLVGLMPATTPPISRPTIEE